MHSSMATRVDSRWGDGDTADGRRRGASIVYAICFPRLSMAVLRARDERAYLDDRGCRSAMPTADDARAVRCVEDGGLCPRKSRASATRRFVCMIL